MFNFARNFLARLQGHPGIIRRVDPPTLSLTEFKRDLQLAVDRINREPPSHLKPAPLGKRYCLQLDGSWKLVKIIPADIDRKESARWPARKRGKKSSAHGKHSRKPKSRSHKARA